MNRSDLILPTSHSQLSGRFKMDVIKPDGRRVEVHPWQENLITDAGMNNYAIASKSGFTRSNAWIGTCWVGTGNTPANFADIGLDQRVGWTDGEWLPVYEAANDELTGGPYYRSVTQTFIFAAGQLNHTLAEVGLGPQPGQHEGISTRALLEDGNGDPTTIVIGLADQLAVTYEVRSYITQLTAVDSQITIANILYNVKKIPYRIDYDPSTGLVYGSDITSCLVSKGTSRAPYLPTDPWDNLTSDTMLNAGCNLAAYGTNNHYRDTTMILEYDEAHWGPKGVTALIPYTRLGQGWWFSFSQDVDVTQGIPKNNTNELNVSFRESWARYTPP